MTGTLSLAGSGEYLEKMDAVDRLLLSRAPGEPRVVCLPTASAPDGAQVFEDWAKRGVAHFTRLGAHAEAVLIANRRDADDEALAARLRAANFIYLSGGKPDYLHRTLKNTRAFAAFTEVLERGGVVAGCSAGAMIWGEVIPNFPIMLPLKNVFNRLPNTVIVPHYDEFGERWGGMIKTVIGNRSLVGIDGYTALVCADGAYRVAGAGGVTVWNKRRKVRYTGGQLVVIDESANR
jgi:cyanophycinase